MYVYKLGIPQSKLPAAPMQPKEVLHNICNDQSIIWFNQQHQQPYLLYIRALYMAAEEVNREDPPASRSSLFREFAVADAACNGARARAAVAPAHIIIERLSLAI